MHGLARLSVRVFCQPFGKESLRVGQRDLLVNGVERVEIIRHEITSIRPYFTMRKGGVKEEGEKSVKKGREQRDNLGAMLKKGTEDEDYKMFKNRCYCQHVAKLLLTFFLGMLFRFLLGKL